MADDGRPGAHVSPQWARWRAEVDLDEYDARWDRLALLGQATHGEADFVASLDPAAVLDAGCGMGRVAIELARRGIDVVGVDLDADLLAYARRRAPELAWVHADLATLALGREFDVVAMPGNVMLFCRTADRPAIVARCAAHLAPGGALVAGFTPGSCSLADYDGCCAAAGLELAERWATWERAPHLGAGYAVSVHRRR
jgi:2-polyprenyl-3-methyl-5-hydroxy-6-metoxy-1,4-benzoquinol methylase